MIRMIHIAGSMSPSGIGNFIMNVYRHIDRTRVQFDFILCEKRAVSFDEEIESLGGRIFYITRKSKNPVKNFLETRRIIKNGRYDIVFRHTDVSTVALDLFAAALGGARHRIPHSHSTSTSNKLAHRLFMPLLNAVSTERFACSEAAGRWLYGDAAPFRVVMNAIDMRDFDFDPRLREETRASLSLKPEQLLIGHVGNLLPVKNHIFILEMMGQLVKELPEAKAVFVGDGVMRGAIEAKIRELSLEDNVMLLGVRNDIPALLMAMDVFVFPSFYEGLPIALVEAQRAGLPCLISENINRDCDVIDSLIKRLPIEEKEAAGTDSSPASDNIQAPESGDNKNIPAPESGDNKSIPAPGPGDNKAGQAPAWAREIIETFNTYKRSSQDKEPFVKKGFDIDEMVKLYENLQYSMASIIK